MRRFSAAWELGLILRPMLGAISMLTLGLWAAQAGAGECQTNSIALRGDWGQAAFTIEIADTPQERSKGLMYRRSLPRRAGMLFVYEVPQRASFWMKNTLIELDLLFADSSGKITHVHHQAIPGDLTPIPGGGAVFAVLEINGGLARRYGITVGSLMQHAVFAQGPAAWPC